MKRLAEKKEIKTEMIQILMALRGFVYHYKELDCKLLHNLSPPTR